jgi:peptidoglycan hydrolase CwlO-like protein
MSDLKSKLKAKREVIESNFKALDQQRLDLVAKRKEIDRRITQIAEELVRLQGEFRALEDLDRDEPKLEIPKKKVS